MSDLARNNPFSDLFCDLQVGSGSGYLLAAMYQLVRPSGRVYGSKCCSPVLAVTRLSERATAVEHIPSLVSWSLENLGRSKEGSAGIADGTISVQVRSCVRSDD
jgi:hypothetical protein